MCPLMQAVSHPTCTEGSRLTLGEFMAEVTYFVALPFLASEDGVVAGEPTECFNPNAAVMRAEALARREGYVGAVAFSRTGDPATGDFSDATVCPEVRQHSG